MTRQTPRARFESSASWIDENGNFWFYGGHQNGSLGYFSDMWKYNPVSNQWAWMNGSITTNQLPVYGVQGIPSPNNSPGGRYVYSHWKECNYFWIFGGDKGVVYADLWRYDLTTNEWTWMSGTDQTNAPGVSGGECIGGMNYHPSGRHESRSNASDQCGNLWLFGGQTNGGTRNDLWVYQVSNNTWTFINGSLNTVSNGKYNTKGISSPTNSPSARFGSIMWNDSNGNFWMFGGEHLGGLQFCNDVWKFSPDPTCPPSPINCGECNFPIAGIIQSPLKFCQNSCIDFYDNSVGSVILGYGNSKVRILYPQLNKIQQMYAI
ncbi:MAG: hypothetical protein IPG39_11820 [Bacteroidetes bacterium]|nr:hypothetical protein [Bacteroidota bacterium]